MAMTDKQKTEMLELIEEFHERLIAILDEMRDGIEGVPSEPSEA